MKKNLTSSRRSGVAPATLKASPHRGPWNAWRWQVQVSKLRHPPEVVEHKCFECEVQCFCFHFFWDVHNDEYWYLLELDSRTYQAASADFRPSEKQAETVGLVQAEEPDLLRMIMGMTLCAGSGFQPGFKATDAKCSMCSFQFLAQTTLSVAYRSWCWQSTHTHTHTHLSGPFATYLFWMDWYLFTFQVPRWTWLVVTIVTCGYFVVCLFQLEASETRKWWILWILQGGNLPKWSHLKCSVRWFFA